MSTTMAIDLADYFIEQYQKEGNTSISETSVNKLIYFTYAWHLAEYDEELCFMEAWKYGPVPGAKVYNYIKASLASNKNFTGASKKLASHILETANFVFENYSKLTKTTFFTITHNEPAFVAVKSKVKAGEQHVALPVELTRKYYKTLLAA